ncbi:hypothetical protein FOZ63_003747 [Perkinsus olseni]|uniref:C3H1-type domain-containing protein n=1 Tax=Perkinsus olseni TaxID=32597 RepID=A0A7J6U2Y8_PEROL|nr:hypothetical protein FOZ63_003747 [Perkinsus olseni]
MRDSLTYSSSIAAAGAHGVGDGKDASRRHRASDGRDAPMVGQGSTPLVQVDEYPAPSLFSAASSLGPDQNPDLYSLSPDTLGQSSYSTAPATTTATHSSPTQHLLLQHAMGLTVDILVTYGVSPEGIDLLRAHGLETVSDLATLDTHSLAHQGYSREDIDTLTRLAIEVGHESTNERLQRMQEQQRNVNGLGEDRFLPIKNTFINFPPSQLTSCKKTPQSCPVDMTMTLPKSFTTTVGNESNLSPVASSHSPESTPIDLDLSVYPSIGSRLHASGTCKPCAWFYHASGCRHGAQCEFCHLCPPGEIKRRKKEKLQIIKLLKQTELHQQQQQPPVHQQQEHHLLTGDMYNTSVTPVSGGRHSSGAMSGSSASHHHHRHHHHTTNISSSGSEKMSHGLSEAAFYGRNY